MLIAHRLANRGATIRHARNHAQRCHGIARHLTDSLCNAIGANMASARGRRQQQLESVRQAAITAPTGDLLNRAVVDAIPAGARIVLIGEASHGTREFYEQRAAITRMLIEERGFLGVVCEADFPDAFRVNMSCAVATRWRTRTTRCRASRCGLGGCAAGLLVAGGGCARGRRQGLATSWRRLAAAAKLQLAHASCWGRGTLPSPCAPPRSGRPRPPRPAPPRPQRFPRWMWRNTSVASFADWLRGRNASLADPSQAAGFYGMDLYR
jgi:erythromycin esterase-like protein